MKVYRNYRLKTIWPAKASEYLLCRVLDTKTWVSPDVGALSLRHLNVKLVSGILRSCSGADSESFIRQLFRNDLIKIESQTLDKGSLWARCTKLKLVPFAYIIEGRPYHVGTLQSLSTRSSAFLQHLKIRPFGLVPQRSFLTHLSLHLYLSHKKNGEDRKDCF